VSVCVGAPMGWSETFVDPSFTIDDPAYASLYHFEGVPGIAPSVPEPAIWVLALLGLSVIFGIRRGRTAMA
jgi:PEP-CTERM motif